MKLPKPIDINTLYRIEHLNKFTRLARIIILLLSFIFLIWFIIPIGYGILNIGNIVGILLCLFFIFIYGFRRTFLMIKHYCFQNGILSVCWHCMKIAVASFLIYALVITGFMVISSFIPPAANSTAIVLGCQVKGKEPSLMLQERINAAANYMIDNHSARLIASGGKGNGEDISEAECIIRELEDDHITWFRMYMEDDSHSTSENMENSIKVIENYGLEENVAVITDFFHQLRARIILQRLDYQGTIGAVNSNTNILFAPTYIVREWFAILNELFFK